MRGEDCTYSALRLHPSETPPHARGRLKDDRGRVAVLEKHPRMRGEDRQAPLGLPACWPPFRKHPRMRGEDYQTLHAVHFFIETPPHARGRPRSAAAQTCRFRKHPRMRGEDCNVAPSSVTAWETPPHARGRRSLDHVIAEVVRNTPACAGKTAKSCTSLMICPQNMGF